MTHTHLARYQSLHMVVSAAFLAGTLSLLSVATGIFAMVSGGGAVVYPDVVPSIGGGNTVITQGQLYSAAPQNMTDSMMAERITLGILLILLGYALHAVVAQSERRVAVHTAPRRRTSRRRR